MLVLKRKVGEKIAIGSGIVVTVLEVNNSQVLIGIDAPREVPVWRSELVSTKALLPSQKTSPVPLVITDKTAANPLMGKELACTSE